MGDKKKKGKKEGKGQNALLSILLQEAGWEGRLVGGQTCLEEHPMLGRILGLASPTLPLSGRSGPMAPVWDGGGDGSFRGDSRQPQGSPLAHGRALFKYWGSPRARHVSPSNTLCQVGCELLSLKLGELKTSFFFKYPFFSCLSLWHGPMAPGHGVLIKKIIISGIVGTCDGTVQRRGGGA